MQSPPRDFLFPSRARNGYGRKIYRVTAATCLNCSTPPEFQRRMWRSRRREPRPNACALAWRRPLGTLIDSAWNASAAS